MNFTLEQLKEMHGRLIDVPDVEDRPVLSEAIGKLKDEIDQRISPLNQRINALTGQKDEPYTTNMDWAICAMRDLINEDILVDSYGVVDMDGQYFYTPLEICNFISKNKPETVESYTHGLTFMLVDGHPECTEIREYFGGIEPEHRWDFVYTMKNGAWILFAPEVGIFWCKTDNDQEQFSNLKDAIQWTFDKSDF